jgi:dihydroorotase
MPNLKPPVRSTDEAFHYRQKIMKRLSGLTEKFEPLMTLYLTDNTTYVSVLHELQNVKV